jgi:hypothetical protein
VDEDGGRWYDRGGRGGGEVSCASHFHQSTYVTGRHSPPRAAPPELRMMCVGASEAVTAPRRPLSVGGGDGGRGGYVRR